MEGKNGRTDDNMSDRQVQASRKRASKKDFVLTSVFGIIGIMYLAVALTPLWILVYETPVVKIQNDTTKSTPFAPARIYFWSSFSMLIFIWPAICHLFMAAAYFGNQRMGVKCLNKDRKTGQISCTAFFLCLPWLITVYVFWFVRHMFNGEDAYNRVYKHFYVGRFPRWNSEFPPEIKNIVDMTAEFSARKSLLKGRTYLCLPSMDRCMPDPWDLGQFALQVSRLKTPTYIHCANGHSRSGLLMAMVMVLRKDSASIRHAFAKMVEKRRWVHYRKYEAKQAVYTLATYCGMHINDDNGEANTGPDTRNIDQTHANAVHPQTTLAHSSIERQITGQHLKRGHTRFLSF